MKLTPAHGSALLASGMALALAGAASGQSRFLVADRTNRAIWFLHDDNNNGTIEEPGEVTLFYNSTDAAGTPVLQFISSLAARRDGLVLVGDTTGRQLQFLRDLNGDGDALDVGESSVCADATNASGVSFAVPVGCEFDGQGRAYGVNAGNVNGNDGVYLLTDLNNNFNCQDAGEITEWVGSAATGFGPGNGPYSPQEIVFNGRTGYLRNSSSGLFGVYRFEDLNLNGRADDAGEFFPVWNSAASGVAPLAGLTIDLDRVRAGSIYVYQAATGPTHQFIRLTDLNSDGDFNDAGEAVLVYTSPGTGFTPADVLSLNNGDLLVTSNASGGTNVVRLHDADNDGFFTTAGERTIFWANAIPTAGNVRQIVRFPSYCPTDLNGDRTINTVDLLALLGAFGTNVQPYTSGDINGDGFVNTVDLLALLGSFGQNCAD